MPIAKTNAKATVSGEVAALMKAAKELSTTVDAMEFLPPVTHVYNPLVYAWKMHCKYLSFCSGQGTQVLFLGMNPGPWGMAQTGVPFGQVEMVRDWLAIDQPIGHPINEHPKRIIEGLACKRSEVSGARLWGLFKERFKTPAVFFKSHFVVNYCPLVFMEESARNRTPDKLQPSEMKSLQSACDRHLITVIETLQPKFLVGVGAYAEQCLIRIAASTTTDSEISRKVVRILHPSPASPAANKDWAKIATSQLVDGGVWRR